MPPFPRPPAERKPELFRKKRPPHPAKKWRVAYIEGGGYTDYQRIFAATAKGLAELGVIADGDVPIPEKTDDTRPIWDWLAEHAGGDRLVFLKDGYYSANWDAAQRAANRKALLDRIREKGDVDMIFAFGTWAGLGMATAAIISVPVFSMSVTDAVQAGIAKSLKDSGRDNLHAQIDPERYKRQMRQFSMIFLVSRKWASLMGYARSFDAAGRHRIRRR